MSPDDARHVFQRLRDGLVPEYGLEAYAVRVAAQRKELHRLFQAVEEREGLVKFLRGDYGCGKTFMARLATLDAQERGFATSFVVVSENDLRFHKFDELYRRVVSELSTSTCPRGALPDLLDRWIGRVEDRLEAAGHDPDGYGFDERVREELEGELRTLQGGAAPTDFIRVVKTVFELKQAGDYAGAGALISWLSGSPNVAAAAKKRAGVKGEIQSADALGYLRGVLSVARKAGYAGLVVVVDEAETLLRRKSDVRKAALNGLRQIVDGAAEHRHLLWLFTGTPDFFESPRGVKSLPPLYDRVRFMRQGDYASLRQAQLELKPFDEHTLRQVALRLRELFGLVADAPDRVESRVTPEFVDRLIADVTEGFGGRIGVVPRQFLRLLVNHLDLVDEHEDYDPFLNAGFELTDLSPEEEAARSGRGLEAHEETW